MPISLKQLWDCFGALLHLYLSFIFYVRVAEIELE